MRETVWVGLEVDVRVSDCDGLCEELGVDVKLGDDVSDGLSEPDGLIDALGVAESDGLDVLVELVRWDGDAVVDAVPVALCVPDVVPETDCE